MTTSLVSLMYFSLLVVCVLVAVSFYTLFERKLISLCHIRNGPLVVGVWGLVQPFSDAIKLFTNEWVSPALANKSVYTLGPVLAMAVAILVWAIVPLFDWLVSFEPLILMLLVAATVGVYSHLSCGWSSNSNYALLGALRYIAQSVSYEVLMAFLVISVLMLSRSFSVHSSYHYQCVWFSVLLPVCIACWLLAIVAETNRAPFDFGESESELVSGFNVEYGSGLFAVLFIGEYTSIIMFSCLTVSLLIGGSLASISGVSLISVLLYWFVWIRCAYPRSRYDKLMLLCWCVLLPLVLCLLVILVTMGV